MPSLTAPPIFIAAGAPPMHGAASAVLVASICVSNLVLNGEKVSAWMRCSTLQND